MSADPPSSVDQKLGAGQTLPAPNIGTGTIGWGRSLRPPKCPTSADGKHYEQYVEPLNVLADSHTEANVRDWARDQLRRIEASIQHEQKREAERELGRY